MEPKVSVMMPARNTEKYIGQAIESIISQTYSNWELIIVDDKSTDSTRKIAQDYCKSDSRIRIINGDGICAANARNNAIKNASGDYIVNMDSDDISTPNRISRLIEVALKYDKPFVGSNVFYTKSNLDNMNKSRFPLNNNGIRAGFQRMFNRLTIMPGTVLTKTEILRHCGYREFCRIMEDWDLVLRISENSNIVFCNIEEPLYIYRLNEGSVTLSHAPRIKYTLLVRYNELQRKKQKAEILSIEKFENFLKNNFMHQSIYKILFLIKKVQHWSFLIKRYNLRKSSKV